MKRNLAAEWEERMRSSSKNPPVNYSLVMSEFVETCKRKFENKLVAIVLFGSVARKEAIQYSDIDMLIIVKGLPKRMLDREALLAGEILDIIRRYHVRISPILLQPRDLSVRTINPLLYGILTGYEILYDATGFWNDFLARLKPRILEKKPIYTEGLKRWNLAEMI